MEAESRPDLIPSCCMGCVAEVVAGVHNGVPAYWVQHGTKSAPVAQTAPEAQNKLMELHEAQKPQTEGDPATVEDVIDG